MQAKISAALLTLKLRNKKTFLLVVNPGLRTFYRAVPTTRNLVQESKIRTNPTTS